MIKIKIKWPNDLLVNQRKFCGILQEVIRFNDFDYLIVENLMMLSIFKPI